MTVRKTESRLPSWVMDPTGGPLAGRPAVTPSELGQAVSSADGQYHLVSFLTSPLVQGSRNNYVIFVTRGTADRYYWKITDDDGRVIEEEDDDVGVFDWTPDEIGDYVVEVAVKVGSQTIPLPPMRQSVAGVPGGDLQPVFIEELTALATERPGMGAARAADLARSAVVGDVDSTQELLLDLWGYVFEAANATNAAPAAANRGVPAPFLAAVLYHSILTQPKGWSLWRFWTLGPGLRSTELEWAADEVNKPDSFQFSREIDNALGVAKIRMETAAMVLDGIAWRDKAQDPKERAADEKAIQQAFMQAFGEPTKEPTTPEEQRKHERRIDLFNLLRFPKTNIALCAKLLAALKNRARRFSNLTQQAFRDNLSALELIATEYQIGAVATPLTDAQGRLVATSNAFGRKVRALTRALFISPHFRTENNLGTIYGDQDLAPGAANPAASVDALKTDLQALGFEIPLEQPNGALNGNFDDQTEWAIREFQLYSKMDFLGFWRQNPPVPDPTRPVTQNPGRAANLRTTQNLFRYGGRVTGTVNRETRRRIQVWRVRGWRCPVVIQARSLNGNNLLNDNVWHFDAVQFADSAPQNATPAQLARRRVMHAWDFSRYYELPQGRDPRLRHPLGSWARFNANFSGPRSLLPDTPQRRRGSWIDSEVLPERLLGPDWPLMALNEEQRATFKVVRAVAEVECTGAFDSMNAYDNAFVSVGIIHWTLGLIFVNRSNNRPDTTNEGELCGYLAYLREVEPAAFQRAIRFFGMRTDERWLHQNDPGPPGTGRALFLAGQRKYAGWISQQTDTGWARAPLGQAPNFQPSLRQGNWYRTWHWFYRWAMASRTVAAFRQRMWDMVRMRLRDVLSLPWGVAPANVGGNVAPLSDGSAATIGDIFTSERATALLLRWHVKWPGDIIDAAGGGNFRASNILHGIAAAAGIAPAAGSPERWTDGHETALVAGIMTEVNSLMPNPTPPPPLVNRYDPDLRDTMQRVAQWPFYANRANFGMTLPIAANANVVDAVGDAFVGTLHDTRDSFKDYFDRRGLPTPPP